MQLRQRFAWCCFGALTWHLLGTGLHKMQLDVVDTERSIRAPQKGSERHDRLLCPRGLAGDLEMMAAPLDRNFEFVLDLAQVGVERTREVRKLLVVRVSGIVEHHVAVRALRHAVKPPAWFATARTDRAMSAGRPA